MWNKKFKNLLDKYLKGWLQKEGEEQWADRSELMMRIDDAEKPAMLSGVPGSRPLLKIVLAVALLAIAGFLFRQNLLNIIVPHRQTYVISMDGQVRKQILSDGTIVWLKGHSKLIFPVKFGNTERAVTLEGEALFEVAKDAEHPFVIHCGTLTANVLGTSFNIRNTGASTELAVLTGQLALITATGEKMLLNPHEKAAYSEPFETIEKDITGIPVRDIITGTEYDMSFKNVAIADVIRRVEKKFGVVVNAEDTAGMNKLITVDLTDRSLQYTMKVIGQLVNLDVDICGRNVLLK